LLGDGNSFCESLVITSWQSATVSNSRANNAIVYDQGRPGLSTLFDKLAGNGAPGNAQLIGTVMHHAGVLPGADVAHQDVGNATRKVNLEAGT
jgi:hypothetical protein